MAQVHVLTGPERRRRFSLEQKRAIVAAAFAPGAVVSNVARQADVCSSLIYRWRREIGRRAGLPVTGRSEPHRWFAGELRLLTYSVLLLGLQ